MKKLSSSLQETPLRNHPSGCECPPLWLGVVGDVEFYKGAEEAPSRRRTEHSLCCCCLAECSGGSWVADLGCGPWSSLSTWELCKLTWRDPSCDAVFASCGSGSWTMSYHPTFLIFFLPSPSNQEHRILEIYWIEFCFIWLIFSFLIVCRNTKVPSPVKVNSKGSAPRGVSR